MSRRNLEPTFSDQSNSRHHVDILRGEMYHRHVNAQELIGVLVYNHTHPENVGSFLDGPISIDDMDRDRLLGMNLIRRAGRSVLPELDEPVAELTRLGWFVINHATLYRVSDEDSLPTVDLEELDRLLADSFSS